MQKSSEHEAQCIKGHKKTAPLQGHGQVLMTEGGEGEENQTGEGLQEREGEREPEKRGRRKPERKRNKLQGGSRKNLVQR